MIEESICDISSVKCCHAIDNSINYTTRCCQLVTRLFAQNNNREKGAYVPVVSALLSIELHAYHLYQLYHAVAVNWLLRLFVQVNNCQKVFSKELIRYNIVDKVLSTESN